MSKRDRRHQPKRSLSASADPDVPKTDASTSDQLATVYGVLYARYQSNTDLQWRVPAFVLPVVFAALTGIISLGDEGTRFALAGVALFTGWVGALLMRRIELTARWDRSLLDEYEPLLLPEHQDLRLLHGESMTKRKERRPPKSLGRTKDLIDAVAFRFEPSASVFLLMVGTSTAVFGVGVVLALTSR